MEKRIESKISLTARMVCLKRAMSYHEKNKHYKSHDYLASAFISPLFHFITKHSISRKFLKRLSSGNFGSYEYIISRTKLIDEIVQNHANEIEQVLIFGAGFDSRAIRFKDELKHATVFELESPITQAAKLEKLKEKNIELPPNLKFISIDFNKESLHKKLDESGFQKDKRTLFILEGLTYYLDQEAIDSTFNLLAEYSGKNSLVIFDYLYASVLRQENIYKGEKEIYDILVKIGEKYAFGIEKGYINEFLSKYGFDLIEDFDSNKLSKKFFSKENGEIFASTIGLYSIALAKK